jgi:hypothetical protein
MPTAGRRSVYARAKDPVGQGIPGWMAFPGDDELGGLARVGRPLCDAAQVSRDLVDERGAMSKDVTPASFAGELFLALAMEERLVIDGPRADEILAELERTLALIRSRLRVMRIWHQQPAGRVEELPDELAQDIVDVVFADQMVPGQLERAAVELPKYIEAIRRARRPLRDGASMPTPPPPEPGE